MDRPIDTLTLTGFKSIRALDKFEMGPINVLIGANGSGKSNFVSFFSLLRELVEGRLERTVNKGGGADLFLFLGPQNTSEIKARLVFGPNAYEVTLEPTNDNRLIFKDETIEFHASPSSKFQSVYRSIGEGHSESKLKEHSKDGWNKSVASHIYDAISSWVVYHFHDTSDTAAMRRRCSIRDNERLRPDGGNLAAFIYKLREEEEGTYELLCDTVRLVAPFFKEFKLRPRKTKDDRILELEWEQIGSDYPFHASQLSDGTLRFIALATALLQPYPPATILIDEPELGLHPFALDLLGNLILQAQERTQLIVSTQSAPMLNTFEPKHIVVVERHEGCTTFKRLEKDGLTSWLEDYSLGELWQKNIYGGGPIHE